MPEHNLISDNEMIAIKIETGCDFANVIGDFLNEKEMPTDTTMFALLIVACACARQTNLPLHTLKKMLELTYVQTQEVKNVR